MNIIYLKIIFIINLLISNGISSEIIDKSENDIYLSISSSVTKKYVNEIVFLNNKNHFLIVGDDNIIRLYDADNKILLKNYYGYMKKNLNNDKLFTISVNNENKYFATAGSIYNKEGNSIIRIFEMNTGLVVKTLEVNNDNISKLEYTKDGKYLISSGKNIIIWDAKSYKKIKTIEMDNFIESFITVNENLVTGDNRGNLFIISINTGNVIKKSDFSNIQNGPISRIQSDGKNIIFTKRNFTFLTDFKLENLTYIGPFNEPLKLSKDGLKLFVNNGDKYYEINDKIKKNELKEPLKINLFDEKTNGNVIEMALNENYLVTYDIRSYKIHIRDLKTTKLTGSIDSKTIRLNSVGINDNNLTFDFVRNKILTWESKHYANNESEDNRIKSHFPHAKKIYTSTSTIDLNNLKFVFKEEILNSVKLENNNLKLAQSTFGNFIYPKSQDNMLFINENNDRFKHYIECNNDINAYSFINNKIVTAGKGGEVKVFEIIDNEKAKLVSTLIGHSEDVISLSVYKNNLVTLGSDSIIKIWKINDNEYIYPAVSIFIDDENEFVIWTEEGYFTVSSEKALKYITWHMNQGFGKEAIRYDIGKFYDVFFRPDLVKLKLKGDDISKYTDGLTVKDALRNPPPNVNITNIDDKNVETNDVTLNTDKDIVKVRFNVSDFGGGVGNIRVYQEGKLIKRIGNSEINKVIANVDTKKEEKEKEQKLKEYQYLALSKAIKGKELKINEQIMNSFDRDLNINNSGDYEIMVPLKKGLNQISVEAFNNTNTITSFRSTVNINANIPEKKAKLYAIVAGVNNFESSYGNELENLRYSVNDANQISQIISETKGKIFEDIEIIKLTDNHVTKDNLNKAFYDINQKASLEDTILFYISTHGKSVNGKFYLFPSNNLESDNLIEFNEIFTESSKLKSLNQVFIIDACQSGSANDIASSVYDSRASVLARSSGIHLLSASTSGTKAFENDKYKHSNFTYEIISALKNKEVDINKDNFISIIELSNTLKRQNTVEKQFPVIQNIGNDININEINSN